MCVGESLGHKDIYGVREHTKAIHVYIQYHSRAKTILNHDYSLHFLVSI